MKRQLISIITFYSLAFALSATAQPKQIKKQPNEQANIPCEKAPKHMSCIPAGEFIRGSNDGPKNTHPQEKIYLQTFYMDQYEVTVEQYEACVKSGKCKKQKTAYYDYSRPKQPKVGIDWYAADTFCKVMGKHLPTEAEWEKAARGIDGRLYPWGNKKATCKEAVIKDHRGRSCGVKKLKGKHPEKGRTLVVGSRPPFLYKLYDMSGNSWEWVADWYSRSYKHCGASCQGKNPKGPCEGAKTCPGHVHKIVRGGSWYWPAEHATTIYRRPHVPHNNPYHHFGFRCAASTTEAKKLTVKESS